MQVLSDQVFRNGGDGRVMLRWTKVGGGTDALELGGNQSYQFVQELSDLTVELLDAGKRYDLATNFVIGSINGNNLDGVNLTVHTDLASLPSVYGDGDLRPAPFVGNGYVGPVALGGGFVQVYSRGDFGGVTEQGAGGVTATYLAFRNQTGPIRVTNAGTIVATGAVSNVRVRLAVDVLSAYSISDVHTATGPAANTERGLVLTVGAGGFIGDNAIDYGVQLPRSTVYNLYATGRIKSTWRGDNIALTYVSYKYDDDDGLVKSAVDHYGEWLFGRDATTKHPVITSRPKDAPGDASPGSPAPAPTRPAPIGWVEQAWDGVTTVYDAVANEAAYLGQNAVQAIQTGVGQIQAFADEQWTRAGETIVWADGIIQQGAQQVRQAGMYLGNKFVAATREAAEAFMNKLGEYGGSLLQFMNKVTEFTDDVDSVLGAIVRNPDQFAANVLDGLRLGFDQFFTNLGTTLKTKLLDWLTGGVTFPEKLPTSLEPEVLGPWLMRFFGLDWDGVQQILTNAVGAGNVALLAQGYEYLQSAWAKSGNTSEVFKSVNALLAQAAAPGAAADKLDAKTLVDAGIDAIIKLVQDEIISKVPVVILQRLNPGGAVLSTIYNGLTRLVNNSSQLGDMLSKGGAVLKNLKALADTVPSTDQNDPRWAGLATAKTNLASSMRLALEGGIKPAITFAAAQLRLSDLPKQVVDTLNKVQSLPRQKVEAAVKALVNKAKGLLGLNGPNAAQYQGLISQPLTFDVNGEKHVLWWSNQNGEATLMRASSPALPRKDAQDFLAGLPGKDLANDSELKGIQAQIDKLKQWDTDQIADEKLLAAVRATTPFDSKKYGSILARILARSKDITAGEKVLADLAQKATKLLYTKAEDDAAYAAVLKQVPSGDQWGGWLQSLDSGKDVLEKYDRESPNAGGPAPGAAGNAKRRDAHAHHIVMKQGDKGSRGDDSFLARSILWTANAKLTGKDAGKLNPFTGLWNFAWAPNWGHSQKYAKDVLARLKKVKNDGPTAIKRELSIIAEKFIDGYWYANGGGKGD